MNTQDQPSTSESRPGSFWPTILGAGLLVACGAMAYQISQTRDLQRKLAASQQDSAELRASLSSTDSDLRKSLGALQNELDQSRQESDDSLAKTQSAAARHAEAVADRIAKKQDQQTQQLSEELGKVKESSLEASTKLDGRIDGITTEVGSVKTDVDTAKTDIQDTKSELQRARGDMGLMSGLIATNGKEIQMLRDLGDRNIYEFTIAKTGIMQKVGDIQLMLRKADLRHNRFNVDVLADDKRVEKKDRTVNEPIQFYTAGARQPYELVVNRVDKNKIVGYLATPKVTVSRNQPAGQ